METSTIYSPDSPPLQVLNTPVCSVDAGKCSSCLVASGCSVVKGVPHLDNTKRHSFTECRRKYYFQYVLNLKTFWGSNALRYGLVWHAGMEAYYQHIKDFGWEASPAAMQIAFAAMQKEWSEASLKENYYADYRTLENCCASFIEYLNHFSMDTQTLKVLNTEEAFKVHMQIDSDEEQKHFAGLKPFHFTGKIDAEVSLGGRTWINEHKTTGQPIDTQVNRLNRSAQVMGYFYAKTRMGGAGSEAPEGALMTVHHLSSRKSTAAGKEGMYGKAKIEFRRVPQVLSENDIVQWRRSFLSVALDIQREQERGLWPMNHDSCFNYGSCQFLGICEQNSNVEDTWIDDQRFYVAEPWEVAKAITASGIIY